MADKENFREVLECQVLEKSREKKELVTLSGKALTESGKLTKSNFFNWIDQDLDKYDDIMYTPEEARKISTHLRKLSTGSTAMVPLYCGGNQCPFGTFCPLFTMGKPPIGKRCILEAQLLKEFIMRYFEEFNVDPNSFTEVGYINELAEIMILEMRLNMSIARPENAELVIDQVTGISSQGDPIIQKQISPYMLMKEKLQSRKSKIIKLMVGDRQEKYKKEAALKQKPEADPSTKMARMRNQLESLQKQLDFVSSSLPESGNETKSLSTPKVLTPEDIINSMDDDSLLLDDDND